MPNDNLDRDLRAVRAALSELVGYTLPDQLVEVAAANGLDPGSWVFATDHATLALPLLCEPGQLIARGRQLLEDAAHNGVGMLVPGDPGWPSGTAADDLPCLWVRGDDDVAGLLAQAVTITGARACTAYGQHVAQELAYALSSLGSTIVAAAGFGIDYEAATTARAAGGRVVLVSAGSVLAEEQTLTLRGFVADAADNGSVVSAFPAGVHPTRARWVAQQHLLATLSAGTVVVEAGATSRAIEVARIAARRGRALCAVPGPVTSAQSQGCHRLIEDGTATLITTGRDVATAIGAHAARHTATGQPPVYEVSGRVSWDDGVWRSKTLPPLLIAADSPAQAADIAFEIAFVARPDASGATLDAAVRGPDGIYTPLQVTTTR